MTKKQRKDVYQMITDLIVEKLEQGTVPWHKPWNGVDDIPTNLKSKKAYRGVNSFWLHMVREMHGYRSPYWVSYKQAKEMGGQVRKGEKSTMVVYFMWLEVEDEKNKGKKKRIPLLRYYNVFNVDQVDGIEDRIPELKQMLNDNERIAACENIVDSYVQQDGSVKVDLKLGSSRACYTPSTDTITMPELAQFDSSEAYYSTMFHEMVHSTGHPSRLNRDMSTSFGSKSYSKEELVAEMGAAYLCGTAGIDTHYDSNAAYISSWLKRLKQDSKLIVQAAGQAQKAADCILGVSWEKEDGSSNE